MLLTCNVPVK
uniref:Uncharacterized protein n=1 Tax=Anguilla anguilla TaxID=7936 RepID=A0A0E9RAI6_ANGAN